MHSNEPEKAGEMILATTEFDRVYSYATGLPLILNNLREHYTEARQLGEKASIARNKMPRLEDTDVTELREFLKTNLKEVIQICQSTVLPVRMLKPIQENIYVDKTLTWIHGNMPVDAALRHSCFTHLFIDGNFHILDGHHRWLSLMLLNPLWVPKVYVIQSDMREILEQLRAFTRKKGRIPNA